MVRNNWFDLLACRLWIKTARGEMHDDPIIFAMKDFGSQVTIFDGCNGHHCSLFIN